MKKVFHPVVLLLAALLFRPAVGAERSKRSDLVYRVPNMDKVTVHSNLVYKTAGGLPLETDVYLPQGTPSNAALPAIIFVLGDASPAVLRDAKDWEFFHSYGRLAAASGFAGVTFNQPKVAELARLPWVAIQKRIQPQCGCGKPPLGSSFKQIINRNAVVANVPRDGRKGMAATTLRLGGLLDGDPG